MTRPDYKLFVPLTNDRVLLLDYRKNEILIGIRSKKYIATRCKSKWPGEKLGYYANKVIKTHGAGELIRSGMGGRGEPGRDGVLEVPLESTSI